MAPNIDVDLKPAPAEEFRNQVEAVVTEDTQAEKRPPMKIVWRNVLWMIALHIGALYGLYLLPWVKGQTILWGLILYILSGLGITAGAHRLWAHKSYSAKLPLRIFLVICNYMAFQNDVIEWARDHRVHHKYSETDADPHNAKRGFFFAHVGWLLVRKHPDVKAKGKCIDLSDLYKDPVLRVQRKFYMPGMVFFCFVVPTVVPMYFWGESFINAYFVPALLRYILVLNSTWSVNSFAHLFGNKPYDRHINPVENFLVAYSAIGEGFHNYHHTFPHDYSTSEYPWRVNLTTLFIDFMAFLGQVTSRTKVSKDTVKRRQNRTGDGSSGFGYIDKPVAVKKD